MGEIAGAISEQHFRQSLIGERESLAGQCRGVFGNGLITETAVFVTHEAVIKQLIGIRPLWETLLLPQTLKARDKASGIGGARCSQQGQVSSMQVTIEPK